MDLTRPVYYRGFPLNNAGIAQAAGPNTGCMIERVSYSNVQGVGYTEKKALGDGLDAGDVFLSGRRISMSGTIHGATPGELFDLKQNLLAAFNPTLAYASAPYNFGYVPLDWYEPTEDGLFAGLLRHVFVNVRSIALPTFDIVRDRIGYNADKGLSLEWQALVEAKDPRIYVVGETPDNTKYFDYSAVSSGSGTFINRGDYPAPMYVLLDLPVTGAIRYWHFHGGGADLTLTVPVLAAGGILRYDGNAKIVTLTVSNIERLRMDLLDLATEQHHPLIQPGTSNWTWVKDAIAPAPSSMILLNENEAVPVNLQHPEVNPLAVGLSRFWFDEAFS